MVSIPRQIFLKFNQKLITIRKTIFDNKVLTKKKNFIFIGIQLEFDIFKDTWNLIISQNKCCAYIKYFNN